MDEKSTHFVLQWVCHSEGFYVKTLHILHMNLHHETVSIDLFPFHSYAAKYPTFTNFLYFTALATAVGKFGEAEIAGNIQVMQRQYYAKRNESNHCQSN